MKMNHGGAGAYSRGVAVSSIIMMSEQQRLDCRVGHGCMAMSARNSGDEKRVRGTIDRMILMSAWLEKWGKMGYNER